MPSSQALSSNPLRRHRLTVGDYYKMGNAGIFTEKDRVELIEGEIIDIAPIGSNHAYTIDKLAYIIHKQIGENTLLRIQNPLHLDQYSELEPDLAIVTKKIYSSHHPGSKETLLVIEVADSSLAYDLKIKTALYAQHHIPEVWVIDLNENKIYCYQQPRDGTYHTHTIQDEGTLSPIMSSQLVLDIDNLWSNQ